MRLRTICLVGAALLAASPAWSHHSHAMYDPDVRITAQARVTDYIWSNPHVWVYVAIENEAGEEVEWLLESGSPGGLTRSGWTQDKIRIGETVTVTFGPMKDGSYGGLLGTVTLPSGETVSSPALDNNLGTDELSDLVPN